jgi:hypothetical protein
LISVTASNSIGGRGRGRDPVLSILERSLRMRPGERTARTALAAEALGVVQWLRAARAPTTRRRFTNVAGA